MRNFRAELETASQVSQRVALAKDHDCPRDMLEMFINYDVEPDVIIAAALNVNCPSEWLEKASIRSGIHLNILAENKRELLKTYYESQNTDEGRFVFSDRDSFLVQHVLNLDNKHAEIHLGKNSVLPTKKVTELARKNDSKNYKENVVLIICPSWGIVFPPYNLAKISGLLRANEYKVTVFDLNIESYHILQEKTGANFWNSEKYHLWFDDKFDTMIYPHLKSYLNQIVNQIRELNPKIIGFSLYNTNMKCSKVVMQTIRDVLPEVTIIVGGPEASQDTGVSSVPYGVINYVFRGEAEQNLLEFLNNKNYSSTANREIIGDLESKIPLDELPFPDYDDYDFTKYVHPDGVSIETSRGCIAQCSFCSETWFWKFRQRTPERVIEEIKDQITRYGINRFWFVDSLANGNLKSFRRLVDLIIENNLKIRWNSYARNDGRMDRDFIFRIAQSGCTSLSYGVESGSQKVLNDMKKKIEVWEAEKNLEDSYDAGIQSHVNWMIGFPTEDNLDFVQSLIFIWNNLSNIHAISPGIGCGPAAFSDLEVNWKTYHITWKEKPFDTTFLGHWYTEGYRNTQLNRFIRIKLFAIFLEIMRKNLNIATYNGQRYEDVNKFYNFTCTSLQKESRTKIPQVENLNLNIFKNHNELIEIVANEYLGISWVLYKGIGKQFDLEIYFDPETDLKNFGNFISVNYSATVVIKVNDAGDYSIKISHELKHETLNPLWQGQLDKEKSIVDKSFNEIHEAQGNFNDLITVDSQLGATVHTQYVNKTKIFTINRKI